MMRLPRVRFTVRRLMFAVAIVAILLAVGFHARRTILFSRLASKHSKDESISRRIAFSFREMAERDRKWADEPSQRLGAQYWREQAEQAVDLAEKFHVLADYHATMKAKYESAARRPWLLVEPDPPEP